jgi:hypothetical protein
MYFSIFITLKKHKRHEGEQMPTKKAKNDNKEKELIKKLEPIAKDSNIIEQINLEDEPIKSRKRK